jgi:hypothetical protein
VQVAPKQTDARVTVSLTTDEQAAPANDGSTQRTVGWVTFGLGGAGLAVGSFFGVTAMSKANEAKNDQCSGKFCPTQAGVTATRDGLTAATAADVGFIAGGALLVAGLVVVLTAPQGVHVAPTVGQGYGGLSVTGAW